MDLGGEMAGNSSQRLTFTQLVHKLTEANNVVKALEGEFINFKW